MDGKAVAETLEGMAASLAALAAFAGRVAGSAAPTEADPLRDEADACLDGMAEAGSMEAMLAAVKVHFAAGYAAAAAALAAPAVSPQERTARDMAVTAEVACALTVSERSAAAFLAEAAALTTRLPLTLSALRSGGISWQHARVMCDETSGLDPVAAAALEGHFLDPEAPFAARGCPAGELVPGRFRAKARSWRERHHPVSIEARHRKGMEDRRLDYAPDRDGMAWLSAYVSADVAAGVWARATEAARALQGPAESRTLTQLRADVAADWLIAGVTEGVPSPKAQVLVTVPVLSLLGAGTEPATLDGYGPVPPSMARRLVADGAGSFLRVLTDPRSGAPLEVGRSSYRVPKAMRQWLRLRDGRCPFPGCTNHSLDNEADHLLAWSDGGGTGITNLGQPCRKHHRLKHTTAWRPVGATRDRPPGWISPAGRSYPSEQQDWEPPHWPDVLTDAPDHGEAGPPLPVDPFPDWALFLAA
ncbi:hypothetical protein JOE31_000044 [Arthrobacter sp. PvP023]|uniref:HNH endonuclease signature motif containing protein n=1 Tax=Micrococcaceae TaxID=1268 RepID=UPI001B46A6D9|nr:HNH endonuclease signature motif containing protein [Arthrobacter sp. PvP023]MBP1133812.1 hypothetical protein [Arthrobacter sp. PvP023]